MIAPVRRLAMLIATAFEHRKTLVRLVWMMRFHQAESPSRKWRVTAS